MKKCPNCSYINDSESLFCQECGSKLPDKQKNTVAKHHSVKSEENLEFVWDCDFCGEEFTSKKDCDFHEKECDKRPVKIKK
jgi:uncharacterized protein with PIN domain